MTMSDREAGSGNTLEARAQVAFKAMNISFVIGIVLAIASTVFLFVRQ